MRFIPLSFALLSLAGPAAAQDAGYYAKVFGGLSDLQGNSATLGGAAQSVSYGSGAIYGGAFGYDYGDRPFRAELEFSYRTGEATGSIGGDYASTTFLLNGYYVFAGSGAFKPYVGLGLGYVTEIDFDVTSGASIGEYSDRRLFAAQAMLGADYSLSERLSLFGELRYFTTETPELSGPGGAILSADYETFDLIAGVTLKF
ncbi:MAG: outer membrane protein [Paracoccaceae bacterium]